MVIRDNIAIGCDNYPGAKALFLMFARSWDVALKFFAEETTEERVIEEGEWIFFATTCALLDRGNIDDGSFRLLGYGDERLCGDAHVSRWFRALLCGHRRRLLDRYVRWRRTGDQTYGKQ
jgi:hypothetical protein